MIAATRRVAAIVVRGGPLSSFALYAFVSPVSPLPTLCDQIALVGERFLLATVDDGAQVLDELPDIGE